jgi:hypothetical protein
MGYKDFFPPACSGEALLERSSEKVRIPKLLLVQLTRATVEHARASDGVRIATEELLEFSLRRESQFLEKISEPLGLAGTVFVALWLGRDVVALDTLNADVLEDSVVCPLLLASLALLLGSGRLAVHLQQRWEANLSRGGFDIMHSFEGIVHLGLLGNVSRRVFNAVDLCQWEEAAVALVVLAVAGVGNFTGVLHGYDWPDFEKIKRVVGRGSRQACSLRSLESAVPDHATESTVLCAEHRFPDQVRANIVGARAGLVKINLPVWSGAYSLPGDFWTWLSVSGELGKLILGVCLAARHSLPRNQDLKLVLPL